MQSGFIKVCIEIVQVCDPGTFCRSAIQANVAGERTRLLQLAMRHYRHPRSVCFKDERGVVEGDEMFF